MKYTIQHDLKISPKYFEAKLKGIKPWEYRINDRDFTVGDFIRLREWDPYKLYSGRVMIVEVVYVHIIDDKFVIMTDRPADSFFKNEVENNG